MSKKFRNNEPKSWKAKSKSRHQYRRVAHITVFPGVAVMDDESAYILPFIEHVAYEL